MNEIDLRHVDLNLLLTFEVLMRECSVSRAAHHLSRTQSAVSHSLSRLRAQLGDPLLVKVGGRMQPSPYALELERAIWPILRRLQQVLSTRETFDAARSSRTFRLAVPDFAMTLFPQLYARIKREAPGVQIEWKTPREMTPQDIAEGQLDLAVLTDTGRWPEGLAATRLDGLQWLCFARRDHPALKSWSAAEWAAWPHVVVCDGQDPHDAPPGAAPLPALERHVAVSVPNYLAVPPLLRASDLLATLPAFFSVEHADYFDLAAVPLPFDMPISPQAVLWNASRTNDPAIRWIRQVVTETFDQPRIDACLLGSASAAPA